MSNFHDQFEQDDEFPDWFHWITHRPVFVDAAARYVLWDTGQSWADEDDECDDEFSVTAYCENEGSLGAYHEQSWNYIKEHPETIERQLRRKLWAHFQHAWQDFLELVDPNDATANAIKDIIAREKENTLNQLVLLLGVGLHDDGFDDVGFSTFDFHVGWDEEHGLSILMHKDRVLAASTGGDFSSRGLGLIEQAKCIQEFDFTEGDYRLNP